jgi:hypothetical protein
MAITNISRMTQDAKSIDGPIFWALWNSFIRASMAINIRLFQIRSPTSLGGEPPLIANMT